MDTITTRPRRIVLVLALSACLAAAAAGRAQQSMDDDTSGFNELRIEQEDKLLVPLDMVDEVWAFLVKRYVDDKAHVQAMDPTFTTSWQLEEFWDIYFDTPDFDLRKRQSGIRHRIRYNLSDPDHKKSGRQLLQVKVNNISDNELDRGEIKFKIRSSEDMNSTMDDEHPLIGLIEAEQRPMFIERLKSLDLDAYSMRPVLTVHDMRSRVYFVRNGEPFMSVSFDQVDVRVWWTTVRFVEIEPELSEVEYTHADATTKAYMESVLKRVVDEVRAAFPAIQQDLTPKYNKAFDAVEAELPFFTLLVQLDIADDNGLVSTIVVLIAIAGLVAATLHHRRTRKRRLAEAIEHLKRLQSQAGNHRARPRRDAAAIAS